MDPLSITASAIAILQVSGVIINACYDYRSRVKDSAKDASRIINELNSLRSIIESLFVLLEEEPENKPSDQSNLQKLAQVGGVLETCKVGLEALEKKLEPKEGWRAVRAAVFWPLKEADIAKALQQIDRTKSSLQLALAVDQRKIALRIQKGIESLTEQISAKTSNIQRGKIFQWLSATNSASKHSEARKKFQDMTGLWLIEGDEFQRWSTTPMSFMWIYGIPGCGKTILCSTIIDTLRTQYQTSEGIALAYFYFDFNDTNKSKVDVLIRSIITQLFGQTPDTPAALEKVFTEFQAGSFQPALSDLLEVLSEIIASFDDVYVVIDALDECEELEEMLQTLRLIQSWKGSHLHIIVTSRDFVDINVTLSRLTTDKICVQNSAINQDISIYLEEKLKTDPKLANWPPHIQKSIRNTLGEGANGMFRWVECQLDSLRHCHTIKDLKKDLDTLPKTLEDTYERILIRIDERHRDSALKILQWLCFAARPVTIEEAAEVLAINMEESCYDPDLKPFDPRDILLLCSTLVTSAVFSTADEPEVRPTYDEYDFVYDESPIIKLAHLSVRDYLASDRIKATKVSFFAIDPQLTNINIARCCLVYLLQPSFTSSGQWHEQYLMEHLEQWPLYHYAAHFWPFHIRESCFDDIDDETWHLLKQFFNTRKDSKGSNYLAWVFALTPGIKEELARNTQPLYYAASFGVTSLIQKLLDTYPDLDVNAGGSRFSSTALQVAVYRTHPAAVELLLGYKADPMKVNRIGQSCLFWAVLHRMERIQKLLEDYGATWTEGDAYRLSETKAYSFGRDRKHVVSGKYYLEN